MGVYRWEDAHAPLHDVLTAQCDLTTVPYLQTLDAACVPVVPQETVFYFSFHQLPIYFILTQDHHLYHCDV